MERVRVVTTEAKGLLVRAKRENEELEQEGCAILVFPVLALCAYEKALGQLGIHGPDPDSYNLMHSAGTRLGALVVAGLGLWFGVSFGMIVWLIAFLLAVGLGILWAAFHFVF